VDFPTSHIATPDVGATEPSLSIGFSGGSWPEAAHAANFVDSTHLTRTCRHKFGLAPPLPGSRAGHHRGATYPDDRMIIWLSNPNVSRCAALVLGRV
jgi:hypothetical protein